MKRVKTAHQDYRKKRVADVIRHELVELLQKANDPRFNQVTITAVHLSSDFSYAKIFVSLINLALSDKTSTIELTETDRKKILTALTKAGDFFRCGLAKASILRNIPKLGFVHDTSIAEGQKISELINQHA